MALGFRNSSIALIQNGDRRSPAKSWHLGATTRPGVWGTAVNQGENRAGASAVHACGCTFFSLFSSVFFSFHYVFQSLLRIQISNFSRFFSSILLVLASLCFTSCISTSHSQLPVDHVLENELDLISAIERERSAPDIVQAVGQKPPLAVAEAHLREALQSLRRAVKASRAALRGETLKGGDL